RGAAAWFLTQRYAGRPRPSNRSAEAAVAPPLDRPLGLVAGEDDMSMSLYASKEEYEQAHAARWSCLDRDGVAMLCKDEADARTQAAESDDCWPGRAPHRAVLLGEVNAALDQKHAEYEDLKACAANNARNLALEIEGWRRIAQRCVTAWTVVRGGV